MAPDGVKTRMRTHACPFRARVYNHQKPFKIMILNPSNLELNAFPIDASTILLPDLGLHAVLAKVPVDNLDKLPQSMRSSVVKIDPGVHSYSYATKNKYDGKTSRYNPNINTRRLHIDSFGAITLHAEQSRDSWHIGRVDFNPCRVIHGHNGRIISESDFLHALSIYRHLVTPMLANPKDAVHLVPGVPKSMSRWRRIEIPFHILDEDGSLLTAIGSAKHISINSKPWTKEGETATFENSNKSLKLTAYRKDIQMVSKRRSAAVELDQPLPAVLRVEVALAKDKLADNLPHVVIPDGEKEIRIVTSFRAHDLRLAHMRVVKGLRGAFVSIASTDGGNNDRVAGMMAWVATRADISLDEQFEHFKKRFLASSSVENMRNAKSKTLTSARKELGNLRNIDLATVFSDEAWMLQPQITATRLERMTADRHSHIDIDPDIRSAYRTIRTRA